MTYLNVFNFAVTAVEDSRRKPLDLKECLSAVLEMASYELWPSIIIDQQEEGWGHSLRNRFWSYRHLSHHVGT